jgi:phosphoglucomutase
MEIHPLAGKPAPPEILIDVEALQKEFYDRVPNPSDPRQQVSFGTSGHRGTPLDATFTEAHILAITQAICEYRALQGIDGPLYMGMDTHAVSLPAQRAALQVLAANGVETFIQRKNGFTPTPVISRAILAYNRGRTSHRADGIVITPSHNPPGDGGFKYNPPHGGPADVDVTGWVQERANRLLSGTNKEVQKSDFDSAAKAPTTHETDFVVPYVRDLAQVIDVDAIRSSGIKIGVDPLGGASLEYWGAIQEFYGLDLTVVNSKIDPAFGFMTVDHDGKIRMDCSSPYAMAGLVRLKDRFEIAFGADTDADRHGIVTRSMGLLNPNAYLASGISYLLAHRPGWPGGSGGGKTVVTSGLIDLLLEDQGRKLWEVPVGFKWFVPGLLDGSICFGGEESAGASFLRRDGTVWTTDKDGLILCLLAAEMTAQTGKDPGENFHALSRKFGPSFYTRIDVPAGLEERNRLKTLQPDDVPETDLAGEPVVGKLTRAPGNDAAIGGLKVVARNGWFAVRPSGTEDVYKLYAESFRSEEHLNTILDEARRIVARKIA